MSTIDFRGKRNIQLTDQGRLEAEMLAKRLSKVPFEIIYSSPLDRAKETAQIISEKQKSRVSIQNDFCEISFGDWEGYTFEEIRNITPWIDE
ncbi:histidine phosphatase family protein [endosymbiont 'TC1' of Trimyema compressum]|uniref:histidine phosphatase family protein n=1 Tax=endosymbiont 'TC1' of Trimyema compressum TaxID=243899 RepID=UPI003CCBCD6C